MGQTCSDTQLDIENEIKPTAKESTISPPTASDTSGINIIQFRRLIENKKSQKLINTGAAASLTTKIGSSTAGPRMEIQSLHVNHPAQEDSNIDCENCSFVPRDNPEGKLEIAFKLIDTDHDGLISSKDLIIFLVDQGHSIYELDTKILANQIARFFNTIQGPFPGLWAQEEFAIFMQKNFRL